MLSSFMTCWFFQVEFFCWLFWPDTSDSIWPYKLESRISTYPTWFNIDFLRHMHFPDARTWKQSSIPRMEQTKKNFFFGKSILFLQSPKSSGLYPATSSPTQIIFFWLFFFWTMYFFVFCQVPEAWFFIRPQDLLPKRFRLQQTTSTYYPCSYKKKDNS